MAERESPGSVTGRRTRRARRVGLDALDAMARSNGSSRARAEGVILPDSAPPDQDQWAATPTSDDDAATPATGTLRTDSATSDDLVPPTEPQFAGRDFLPAPGLRRVATALIARDRHLRHLNGLRLEFLWKRRGGSSRGQPNVGNTVLPAGLTKHAMNAMARAMTGSSSEAVTFVVWLASDHLQEWTSLQIEANLYRQLLKTGVDPRDHNAFKLRAPDFVGFVAEVERYGLWNQSLVNAAPAFGHAVPTTEQQPSFNSLLETTSLATDQTETTTITPTSDDESDEGATEGDF